MQGAQTLFYYIISGANIPLILLRHAAYLPESEHVDFRNKSLLLWDSNDNL